ncbi:MAG: hypothetical protein P0Y56_13045 [Candidatus Andeanibacterium colombiense]|uniref:Uncharacterized protein n=1 Tax=Candidatus Andeanibacterium colombiense TaxID=3121345 RepID=A0AAJ5X5G0_9SPHN|nr:MAG: hypothetical protein P0Y56_13045 [Sphingomonadaceae bacterium]
MPIFTITYDLRAQGKKFDYNPFAEELRKQRCFQIQNSTWLGSFANNATQVHNHFKKLLDSSDSLLVSELFQHFCYTGGAKNVTRWLEANKPTPLPGAKPEDTLEAGIARARAEQAPVKAAAKKPEAAAKRPAAKKAAAKKA